MALSAENIRKIQHDNWFKGVMISNALTQEHLEGFETFAVRDDDVFVASYPKTGNTWVRQIVSLLYCDADPEQDIPTYARFPFFESYDLETQGPVYKTIETAPSPRLIMTHLPYDLMPKNVREGKGKVVYVTRNPHDTAVSFFHFSQANIALHTWDTFDEFLSNFLDGRVTYGDFYRNVLGFWKHKDDAKILFLKYEDMQKDLYKVVVNIADFLGKKFPEESFQRIVHHCHFSTMKDNPRVNYEPLARIGILDFSKSKFMRKGIVGDWKNYFSTQQKETADQLYRKKTLGTDLQFDFEPCESAKDTGMALSAENRRKLLHDNWFKGVMLANGLTQEHLEGFETFAVRDDDVFVASYPKTGSTWVRQIVSLLYCDADPEQDISTYKRFPFFESYNLKTQGPVYKTIETAPSPRLIVTHLPYDLMPKDVREGKGKVVYVTRNPHDTAVSFFHFSQANVVLHTWDTFDEFLSNFLDGKVAFGDFYRNVLGFWKHKDDANMLFLKYEDMQKDLYKVVVNIADFLGKKYPEESLQRVVDHCHFSVMKDNPRVNHKPVARIGLLDFSKSKFMRKGIVGDWKNYFSAKQKETADQLYRQKTLGTGLNFDFEPCESSKL
ncbi:SULT1C4 [Branchiostoma lanceolatum]|uniref:SULT1C4 protein n=1 Tax=Branchiostoma lanceolatum TaxID=7740 RepID=A0A8K0AC31_BRALA|nr:SULT1C4 [Branchiostoma lanceolatum]